MTAFFIKFSAKMLEKQLKVKNLRKWDTMFDGPLLQKGRFKEHQFSLKQMSATHFICIIKWHIAMIFLFNEKKQWKLVSVQIFKNI